MEKLFVVASQYTAERYTSEIKKYCVISITDGKDNNVEFVEDINRLDVLNLKFSDLDKPIGDYKLFSENDAKEIIQFVEKYFDKVDFFLVHCHAGISRSAGCAAALSKIYNNTDKFYFESGKYVPNMLVYKTILNYVDKTNPETNDESC